MAKSWRTSLVMGVQPGLQARSILRQRSSRSFGPQDQATSSTPTTPTPKLRSTATKVCLGPVIQMLVQLLTSSGSFTGNAVAALTAASPATSAQPASTPLATPGHSSNSKPQYTGKAHQITHKMIMAHAAILSLVFFFFMPVAVILLRAPFMKSWAFTGHWVFQLIAWVMSVAGLGLSIAMAMRMKSYANLDFYHGIIGILVICLTIIQPLSGIYHHMKFVKIRRRTSVSWAHISFGWVIIFLGMLNGTFGLMLAGEIDAAGGLGAAGLVILIILILTSSFAARRKAAKTPIRGPPPPSPPTMERKKDIEMVVAAGERSGEDSSS